MAALGIVLLVVFVIVCFLAIMIVLLQGESDNGMGGLMGGQNSAVFGAQSENVLTKTTYVLVVLFFLGVIGLALVYKADNVSDDLHVIGETKTSLQTQKEESADWIEAETKEITGENAQDTPNVIDDAAIIDNATEKSNTSIDTKETNTDDSEVTSSENINSDDVTGAEEYEELAGNKVVSGNPLEESGE